MSNEERERTMAFIVAQQAQFSVDIQLLREAQKETAQNLAQHEKNLAQTAQNLAQTEQAVAHTVQVVAHTVQVVAHTGEIVERLANVMLEGFKDVNAKINALVDSQIRIGDAMVNSQTHTDRKFEALAESQTRTDEKLEKFIAGLDRYFKEGRNGG